MIDDSLDPMSSFLPNEALILFNQIGYFVVITIVIMFIFLLTRKFIFFMTWRSFRDGPYNIGYHQWRPGNLAGPQWCNICESLVYGIRSYVVACDICGMHAHAQCAAKRMKNGNAITTVHDGCKTTAVTLQSIATLKDKDKRKVQVHQWVKGNVDPMDTCAICGLFCGSILALSGMKCAWCHLRVHESCYLDFIKPSKHRSSRRIHHRDNYHHRILLEQCDFGPLRKLILPPSSVILKDKSSPNGSKSQSTLLSMRHAAQNAVLRMSGIRKRLTESTSSTASSSLNSNDILTKDQELLGAVMGTDQVGDLVDKGSSFLTPEGNNIVHLNGDKEPDKEGSLQTNGEEIIEDLDGDLSELPFNLLPPNNDGTPLLVFINSKSGGRMGLSILREMRKWLNPVQVFDLADISSPIDPLKKFLPLPRLRILICGGDGTIGWILGALDELAPLRLPPIAILPLGTGNDLARVLGWGSGLSTKPILDWLTEVEAAHVSLLDRWQISINDKKHAVMNNYFGIGVDAQIGLEFHEQRQKSPGLFLSQLVNVAWYTRFGFKNFLARTCAGLPDKMVLECDGQIITLPEGTEGVIVLNVNSHGGGSTPWKDEDTSTDVDDLDSEISDADSDTSNSGLSESEIDSDGEVIPRKHRARNSNLSPVGSATEIDSYTADSPLQRNGSRSRSPRSASPQSPIGPQKMRKMHRILKGSSSPHDGLLDVVAVYGALHLGQLQVGLSKAVRLCQAKSVKFSLMETLPMQIDGEPWLQKPCQVDISFHQQAFMLSRTVQERDFVSRKVGEVLDWAENNQVISSTQRDILLTEISRRVADEEMQLKGGSGNRNRRVESHTKLID